MLHTVTGDDGARPVFAAPAVNEGWLALQQRKDVPNLVRSRGRPGAEGHADVAHTQGRDLLSFPQRVATVFAEVDHQLHALGLKLLKGSFGGYRAAIEMIVYLAEIPDVNGFNRTGPNKGRGDQQRGENLMAIAVAADWKADSGPERAAEDLFLQPRHIEWCCGF